MVSSTSNSHSPRVRGRGQEGSSGYIGGGELHPPQNKGPDGAESGEFLGPVLYQFVRNRDLKNIECS